MKWPFTAAAPPDPVVLERIRAVEVPPLTEAKRYLVRDDVAGALLYAYPQVVADLAGAYEVEFPEGFTHEEIVTLGFTDEMRPLLDFFDQLYRLYSPVRYGARPSPGSGDQVLELLTSLYSAEPMWRRFVAPGERAAPTNGSADHATADGPMTATEG